MQAFLPTRLLKMQDVIAIDPTWSHRVFQDYYILPERAGLIPNRIFVRPNGAGVEEYFRTNSWGLKGPEPDGSKPVVVVWGDSVIFGNGPAWAERLSDYFPQFHFLNGGIEGDFPDNIISRMLRMNAARRVHANIFFPGWHVRGNATSISPLLESVFSKKILPRAMLLSLPSALSPTTIREDWQPHFKDGADGFTFFGPIAYSKERAEQMFTFVTRRNGELKACAQQNDLPFLDFFSPFQFEVLDKAKTAFSDICHPRPSFYGPVAEVVAGLVRPYL